MERCSWRRRDHFKSVSEKLIKGYKGRGWYVRVYIKGNRHYRCFIHRLVAETFIPNPENKPFVNHIDGNKQNNHAENLEWVTNQENIRHAWEIGLNRAIRGEDHGAAKLKNSQIQLIKIDYRNGINISDLSRKYHVSRITIRRILTNKSYKNIAA